MEKQHEEILNRFEKQLETTLNLRYLIPMLENRNLLTKEEVVEVSDTNITKPERNIKFLSILKTKGSRAFSHFLEALHEEKKHCGHEDMYHKLSASNTEPINVTSGSTHSSAEDLSSHSPHSDTMEHVTNTDAQAEYSSTSSLSGMMSASDNNLDGSLDTSFKEFVEQSIRKLEETFNKSTNSIKNELRDLKNVVTNLQRDVHYLQQRPEYSSTIEGVSEPRANDNSHLKLSAANRQKNMNLQSQHGYASGVGQFSNSKEDPQEAKVRSYRYSYTYTCLIS